MFLPSGAADVSLPGAVLYASMSKSALQVAEMMDLNNLGRNLQVHLLLYCLVKKGVRGRKKNLKERTANQGD